ncbi:cation:proton antiporter [Demequina aurantiaca]|uniref:cation:proton antiporter n=1 Tax=Demequina aurantiaca TaxID=676200 RepID=UPI0007858FEB|nr:sodium:proton antiporter [Demequina aurantiaca]
MNYVALLVFVLALGMVSQLVANRFKIPAIVVLIAVGLTVGPFTGLVTIPSDSEQISEFIGLGVAVILFEGSLDLRIGEFRRVGHGVGRLVIFGPPIAMALGATFAHYVAGFSWPVAIVTGAILVVTGPTVIVPLLRQARMNKDTASLLKWEGIVNDPVGVLLAVVTFQYFTLFQDRSFGAIVVAFLVVLATALVLGGVGGWLIGRMFRSGIIPAHLKSPLLLVLVLLAYVLGNRIEDDAGLLVVTAMGLVIGNMNLPDRDQLVSFKESLTVLLLSSLFIIIPAQLSLAELQLIDWRIVAFVLVLMFVVRPATVLISTAWAPMRREDKTLLAWIAPRGIVAAATAGVFGPALVDAGYADADQLLPTVFLVIIVTVLAHGLTLGPLARKLGLAAKRSNGLLIVGASDFTRDLASVLHRNDVDVLVADASYRNLQPIRMDEVPVFNGEVLSEHAEDSLDIPNLSYVLCASSNDYYNALVSRAMGGEFGFHRTFQLTTHEESLHEAKRLTLQQRGSFAFDGKSDSAILQERMDDGWSIHTTKITKDYAWADARARLEADTDGDGWMLVAGCSADGTFRLESLEHPLKPEAGWRVFYFARNTVLPRQSAGAEATN